jgi:hypothetical protein
MNVPMPARTFRLAPMSPIILIMTLVLLLLPIAFTISILFGARFHVAPAILVAVIYFWIWLRFRPSSFVVCDQSLDIIWPLKHRSIPLDSISAVRILNSDELKQKIGWGMRMGAGGLGGGFGWLWTKRLGLVQMYVSRTDTFVWIERKNGRPWLITPEQPEVFVTALLAR